MFFIITIQETVRTSESEDYDLIVSIWKWKDSVTLEI
jgi:hypothetical protein